MMVSARSASWISVTVSRPDALTAVAARRTMANNEGCQFVLQFGRAVLLQKRRRPEATASTGSPAAVLERHFYTPAGLAAALDRYV